MKFWRELLGKNHCILPIQRFYENVNLGGRNAVLEFTPKEGGEVILPGLWDTWGEGKNRLDTFAVITDDPNPEVAETGHDRTPIPMKDENIDRWLNPGRLSEEELFEIMADKRRFYFKHQKTA